MLTGEPQTPHFYDLGTFERVLSSQSQLFLSLETPGHQNNSRKTQNMKNIFVANFGILKPQMFDMFRKDGLRTMMNIRSRKSPKPWIWDQYLSENMK